MTTRREMVRSKGTSRIYAFLLIGGLGAVLAGCGGGGGGSPTNTSLSPSVTSAGPVTGTVGTEVSIVGSNFRSGVTATLGGITVDSIEFVSSTQIFASVPAGVAVDTPLTLVVRNSDGTQTTLTGAFTAVAPTLDFVNSATKPSGNMGSTVIIEGDAFGDVQGTGQILFSDGIGGTIAAAIAAADDWTNTFIVTTVPASADDGPIAVTTATGTSNTLPFDVTSAAAFSPSTISWTATTSLPMGLSGHQAAFVPIEDAGGLTTQFVYVVGGSSDDGVPQAEVGFAVVQADGTLGAWASTSALPAGRSFHGLVAATPFNSKVSGNGELYVLGGIDTVGGQPVTMVYRGQLNEDGTIDSWTETQLLPDSLHSLGVAIFRGAIYIAGGATTDNAPVSSVYRARPDTTGELSAWDQLPALPSARAHHDLVTFGGFLYSVGGESAAVTPDDGTFLGIDTKLSEVAYVGINLRTGDLADTTWTLNANELSKNRSKHSAVVAGGNIFVTSGLYNGANTGSSENTFAQINSDGTVGTFTGATGANTLLSEGGATLFNQTAISYLDGDGVSRVMIVGGDNINIPGSKRMSVLFY
jgi:hypothetical protein